MKTGPAKTDSTPVIRSWVAVIAAFSPVMFAGTASACSLVSVEAARWESIVVAGYYWIASIVLGAAIVGIVVYCRRWLWSPVVVTALLVFHPTWTVAPHYYTDCSFQNVEASKFVLILIALLLAYQIFSIKRSSRKASLNRS